MVDAGRDALGREVRDGRVRRAEPQVGEDVHQHAVQLLGHPPVEGAQAGLDVPDRHMQLGRDQRRPRASSWCRRRRAPRRAAPPRRPAPGRRASRAVCSACVPDPLSMRRSAGAQAELLEEDLREVGVVVLAGVDEHVVAQRPSSARATGAALMNCGRLPTTETTFIGGEPTGRRAVRSVRLPARDQDAGHDQHRAGHAGHPAASAARMAPSCRPRSRGRSGADGHERDAQPDPSRRAAGWRRRRPGPRRRRWSGWRRAVLPMRGVQATANAAPARAAPAMPVRPGRQRAASTPRRPAASGGRSIRMPNPITIAPPTSSRPRRWSRKGPQQAGARAGDGEDGGEAEHEPAGGQQREALVGHRLRRPAPVTERDVARQSGHTHGDAIETAPAAKATPARWARRSCPRARRRAPSSARRATARAGASRPPGLASSTNVVGLPSRPKGSTRWSCGSNTIGQCQP